MAKPWPSHGKDGKESQRRAGGNLSGAGRQVRVHPLWEMRTDDDDAD
ncbi:hypothetical protein [Noviherbaspirillum aerium]|nr:hypothetical protein [Noviherbaspirillum aerium]